MKAKQSILEDYSEYEIISMKDIARPDQKYIHFWDFLELDDEVHEFQAKMVIAMRDLRRDIMETYKQYYTRAQIQSPERFTRHAEELSEIEFLLDNPFFLAIVHFALTKDIDEKELRFWSIACKKRLMERRLAIKEELEREISESSELMVK
jgi:hypothetical protein